MRLRFIRVMMIQELLNQAFVIHSQCHVYTVSKTIAAFSRFDIEQFSQLSKTIGILIELMKLLYSFVVLNVLFKIIFQINM